MMIGHGVLLEYQARSSRWDSVCSVRWNREPDHDIDIDIDIDERRHLGDYRAGMQDSRRRGNS